MQIESARLTLRGHESTAARLEVETRPRGQRMTRAALSLLGFWALAVVVAFIPPHIPWALAAIAAGVYLALRQWRSEYRVVSFEAACPRCGAAVTMEAGTKLHLPHTLTCFNCHHQPVLEGTLPRAA